MLEELASIEDKLDEQEDRLNSLKARYDEATKLADENERAHVELRNRGQIDTTKLDRLQIELNDLMEKNEEVEVQYQEVSWFTLSLLIRHCLPTKNGQMATWEHCGLFGRWKYIRFNIKIMILSNFIRVAIPLGAFALKIRPP